MSIGKPLVRAIWTATPFKSTLRPVVRAVRTSPWLPLNWPNTLSVCRILAYEYGHLRSAALDRSIDAAGEPVPWISYPAIEYLNRLDFSGKRVFEYGSGNSTRYWAKRAAHVLSVEHEAEYYELIKAQLSSNCELALRRPADVYVASLEAYSRSHTGGRGFDVIVIDGHSRVRCAELAPDHLAPGGVIILDNADWFPDAAAHLRAAGLLEVSFAGFTPIAEHTTVTSFFFHREFSFPLNTTYLRPAGSVPKPGFEKVR